MKSEKTEIQYKNTLDDALYANRIFNKYEMSRAIIINLLWLFGIFYGALYCFKEYYFLREVLYRPLSEALSYFLSGIFLSVLFLATIFYFTVFKKLKVKHFYKRDVYSGCTRLFTAGEGGITVSSANASRHCPWERINCLIESSGGFTIWDEDRIVHIPARFISAEQLLELKELFSYHIPDYKLIFKGSVNAGVSPELCKDFRLIDLAGKPRKTVAVYDLSFREYAKLNLVKIRYFYPNIYVILSAFVLFSFIITIFSVKKILPGLLLFAVLSAVMYLFFKSFFFLALSRDYDIKGGYSIRVSFYENAIFTETRDSISVLEYKNISSYSEKSKSLSVMGCDTVIRLTADDTDELEKIKEIIRLKTINNQLTI